MIINISLISDDQFSSKILELTLSNRATDICRITSENEADLGILFIDSYFKNTWKIVRDELDFPLILISSTPLPDEPLSIKKPFQYTALLDFIIKVRGQLPRYSMVQEGEKVVIPTENNSAEPIRQKITNNTKEKTAKHITEDDIAQAAEDAVRQVKKDNDLKQSVEKPANTKQWTNAPKTITNTRNINAVPAPNKNTYFEPLNYLLGYLAKVMAQKQPNNIKMFEWNNMWLVVNEKQKTAKANISKRLLPHLTVIPINEIPMRNLTEAEEQRLDSEIKLTLSVEDLLWFITPFIAGQALPEGFNQEQKYLLNTWPNFTQHHGASDFLAVTSYWVDESASTKEVAKLFDFPLKELAPFVTSCYLCGFLDTDNTGLKNSTLLMKSKNSASMKSMLQKILTRFKRGE